VCVTVLLADLDIKRLSAVNKLVLSGHSLTQIINICFDVI
jgi:hypothetical protein